MILRIRQWMSRLFAKNVTIVLGIRQVKVVPMIMMIMMIVHDYDGFSLRKSCVMLYMEFILDRRYVTVTSIFDSLFIVNLDSVYAFPARK